MFKVTIMQGDGKIKSETNYNSPDLAINAFYEIATNTRTNKNILTLSFNNLVKWQFLLEPRRIDTNRWVSKLNIFTNEDERPKFIRSDEFMNKYNISSKKLYSYTTVNSFAKGTKDQLRYFEDYVKVQKYLYINDNSKHKFKIKDQTWEDLSNKISY